MSFPAKIIRQARKRAKGLCEGCGMPLGPSNPGECHHVRAQWKDGERPDHSLENARFLGQKCCHRAISIQEATLRAAADRQSRALLGGKKSKFPALPGCKRSAWKKTFSNGWVRR